MMLGFVKQVERHEVACNDEQKHQERTKAAQTEIVQRNARIGKLKTDLQKVEVR